MINVLINAYACSPHWGSEPGMAWNWISCLAQHCNLFVITEGEWRKEIEEAVSIHPYRDHMHFYYHPVPDKIRRMCWNQGDWRFYWYYQKWQKKTLQIARQIVSENRIDILHQLNMIGFREPGYLWKIEGVPFVWGPIGGMELMPLSFLKGVSKSQYIKACVKNLINDWQRKHHPRVLQALHRAFALIAATKGCADVIQGYHHQDVVLINETGCSKNDSPENLHDFHKPGLELMWVGKFDSRKQLGLAIATMEQLRDISVKMHIVGAGSEAESRHYQNMASQSGVDSEIVWHGLLSNQEVQEMMRKADLLLFTSIMEGTPHVVLEAVKNNLPVLCLKTCGQGEVVDSSIGCTIPLTNPKDCVRDFAAQIRKLYDNRDLLQQMSDTCYQKQIELSWENKALRMMEVYKMGLSYTKSFRF
ncbi:glycosyltransferase [Akkermansia sp. N21116]|jgi:glycosyltransferase involved in cell wall biosynthesis|uniref:glycosyltransferase family 4 protein n=1 Tax=Akkermansia sp. N21116 TaxID=3040764 RepID=UPI00244E9566|nr:glycosyltransferase [Akkermansia sp. N21116]WPX40447.1 glycosyltransferase [Akkermansia sp. N21116]